LFGFACSKTEPVPSTDVEPSGATQVVGATDSVYQVGQRATNGVFELTVKGVKTCGVEPHFQPPLGVQKLGVEIELRGLTDAQVPANPFYALIVDAGGQRFEASLSGCKPVLAARRLQHGESITGWVSFDVPESLESARFRYEPVVIGAGNPSLTFEIDP
jgi:hypothetical protein